MTAPTTDPSVIAKLLKGLNDTLSNPANAGTTGFAEGLLQASAPHMLTPVTMGQAMGMGQAASQAYQAQALKNAIAREAMLPFQVARTKEFQQALANQRNPNLTPQQRADNASIGLQFAGIKPNEVPGIAGQIARQQTLNQFHTLGPNARGYGPPLSQDANAQGPLPMGSVQGPAPGTHGGPPLGSLNLNLLPGAAGAIQGSAANQSYGSSQGSVPAQVAVARAAPKILAPGTTLGSMSAGNGMSPAVARMVGAGVARGAPPPVTPASTGTPSGAGVTSGIPLSQAEVQKGQGKQATDQAAAYQQQAENAKETLAQVGELRMSANDFAPGQFAEARIKGLQWMQSLGLITPAEEKELGSAQEGTKMSIQLQSTLTRSLGSREAAQVFATLGRGVPNLTLSPDGFGKMTAYMEGMARYNIARAQKAQSYFNSANVKGVNNVRDQYIANSNPAYFIIASAPPAIQREMIAQMGAKARPFLEKWAKATAAGWAPSPTAFASQP